MSEWQVLAGDCVEVMAQMPESSVDAVVTDPPYGIRFMGKAWDDGAVLARRRDQLDANAAKRANPNAPGTNSIAAEAGVYDLRAPAQRQFQAWCEEWASEAWRVLKPGGHLLAFGGTRTSHRLACAIEDAGFEIRDTLQWIYGSGFPKSLNVGKAIDKMGRRDYVHAAIRLGVEVPGRSLDDWTKEDHAPGDKWWGEFKAAIPEDQWQRIEREVLDNGKSGASAWFATGGEYDITAPATQEAKQWDGWGTALKPAHEPIIMARKPLSESSVARNVLKYGTGAINVDGTRVQGTPPSVPQPAFNSPSGQVYQMKTGEGRNGEMSQATQGRWPPNLLLSHHPDCNNECVESCPVLEMDRQSGMLKSGARTKDYDNNGRVKAGHAGVKSVTTRNEASEGGASRFFPNFQPDTQAGFKCQAKASRRERNAGLPEGEMSSHPTVKPLALMDWLITLITPPGGTVLDPFCGSGSTGCSAVRLGFDFIGIEKESEYVEIARRRIAHHAPPPDQETLF